MVYLEAFINEIHSSVNLMFVKTFAIENQIKK